MKRVLRAQCSTLPFHSLIMRAPILLAVALAISSPSAFAQSPTITSISPTGTFAGGPTFTITVSTTIFSGSVVSFNGNALASTGTGSVFTATVPGGTVSPSLLINPGVVPVTISGAPGSSANFTINRYASGGTLTSNPSGTVAF